MPDVRRSKALYYPHAEFGSAAWLKSALLFWEGVVRPKPFEVTPQDDPETRELVAAGLVEDIRPEPFRHRVMPAFGNRVDELLQSHGGRLPPSIPAPRGFRGSWPERDVKMRDEMAEELEALGYAPAAKAVRKMLPQSRALIATLMADEAARERGLAPVTDDPMFAAIDTFDQAELTHDLSEVDRSAGQDLAELCLPTPSLEAIAQLPVERLLEIRHKYAAQRRRFRERVQAEVTAIAELPSLEAIQDHLKIFGEEIRDDLEGARQAVKDAKVNARWSFLGVSAPASIAAGVAIAQASSTVFGPVGGVGALALSLTSWFMQKRKRAADPGSNYLLSLDAALIHPPGQALADALRKLMDG
jgi:hypothetical protein